MALQMIKDGRQKTRAWKGSLVLCPQNRSVHQQMQILLPVRERRQAYLDHGEAIERVFPKFLGCDRRLRPTISMSIHERHHPQTSIEGLRG